MAKTSWGVEDIKCDVQAMELLLQARPSLTGSEQLQNTLKHKVKMFSCSGPADLAELYKVLQECRLPERLCLELGHMLDEKAAGAMETSVLTRATLVPQQCDGLGNYFTQGEFDALMTADMWKGSSIIAHRLKMIGMRSMKEKTKKLIVALLFWFHMKRGGSIPDKQAAYALAQHVGQTFASCTTAIPDQARPLAKSISPKRAGRAALQSILW